ncbi:MAG: sulfatase family protein [Nocardioidaceae bacterium]
MPPQPSLSSRTRPLLLVTVLALLVGVLSITGLTGAGGPARTAVAQQVSASGRPNIVVVMADDMRVDELRYMPAVRKLVKDRGLLFRNSFSPYPLCCPARASFLTGQYAHNHHVFSHEAPWGFRALDDHETVATALHRSGYRTAFIGKYLNGYGAARSLVTGKPSWHYVPAGWTDWYGAVERPRGSPYKSGGTYNYFHTIFNVNGVTDDSHKGDYQTDVLGGFARKLVRKYSRSPKPFFMWFSAVAPHFGGPREADDPRGVRRSDGRAQQFATPARPGWVKGRFDARITRGAGMPVDGGPSEADMSDKPWALRHLPELNGAERRALTNLTRQRAEAVYVLDRQVAKLVATLKKTHEYAHTLIMFTSDNGYFLGEHRIRQGKIKAHEPSLRVPFLVAGPGVPHGERFDPVTTEDITATITDYAGATGNMALPADGVSVRRTIVDGDQGWTIPVETEGRITGVRYEDAKGRAGRGFDDARDTIGIRTPRYAYLVYSTGEKELYDLDRDPNELRSVVHDPDYAAVRLELQDLWQRYKDCAGATCTAPMPADLQRGPAQLRTMTDRQSRGVQQRYGYWR